MKFSVLQYYDDGFKYTYLYFDSMPSTLSWTKLYTVTNTLVAPPPKKNKATDYAYILI